MTGRYQTRFGHEFNSGATSERAAARPRRRSPIGSRRSGYATCAIGKWHLGERARVPADDARLRRVLRHAGQHAVLHPTQFVDSRVSHRRPARSTTTTSTRPTPTPSGPSTGSEQAQGQALVPLPAVQRPARAAAGAARSTSTASRTSTDEKRQHVRGHDVGDGRRRRPGAGQGPRAGPGGEHADRLPLRQRRPDARRRPRATARCAASRRPPGRGASACRSACSGRARSPAGKTYEHPIIQLDILPTALAAAGAKVDPAWKLDGVNLLPYLTGEAAGQPHETLYWRFGEQWAIRHGDWKLVVANGGSGKPELYNLADDIGESKDLAAPQPEKVKELQTLYDALERRAGRAARPPGQPGAAAKKAARKKAAAKKAAAKKAANP